MFDESKRTSKVDGKRVKVPAEMTYAEWKSRYVEKVPAIKVQNYKDVAKIRKEDEFLKFANDIKPEIEYYTGRKSKWSGSFLFEQGGDPGNKLWDCRIRLNPDVPLHALLHEMIHSCSVSHFGKNIWAKNIFEEELTIHYLSQELALIKGITVVGSGYDKGVELIRDFKATLGINVTDLKFASELVKQPLGERWDWLWEKISDKMNAGAPIAQGQELMSKLEELRQWTP